MCKKTPKNKKQKIKGEKRRKKREREKMPGWDV